MPEPITATWQHPISQGYEAKCEKVHRVLKMWLVLRTSFGPKDVLRTNHILILKTKGASIVRLRKSLGKSSEIR